MNIPVFLSMTAASMAVGVMLGVLLMYSIREEPAPRQRRRRSQRVDWPTRIRLTVILAGSAGIAVVLFYMANGGRF